MLLTIILNSSVNMQAKSNRRVPDGEITRAKINTFVNLKETFANLTNWLSPRQYELVL